ncbi:MAG: NAD-dependent epimerase/dehydratase family protein [Archangium sp.]|nr:NAD-dependent epimerase/dehydratase family protein [Archangium sp.]
MKALVTGGGGFLGSALVKRLLGRGDSVRVIARGEYPELRTLGAEVIQGDIRALPALTKACEGVDVVFHTAAKAGGWGDKREYESINVTGTENVIAACKAVGVRALVYTSSPSVVHDHAPIEGGNESLPYASRFLAHYPRTKAIAEQRVRAAGDDALRTISLRPHFIWGPGDRHLLPRLLARAKTGRLRQVGTADPKTDAIYIDNCVEAHVLAADKLLSPEGGALNGKVYFVSDGDPQGVWTLANRMLAAAGAPKVGKPIPAWAAYAVGAVLEAAHGAVGSAKEPLMTRFAASELSTAQWYDISAARKDLGYAPLVTVDEGFRRLETWCRQASR